ncbi:MFS transporter [Lactobacillus delbrueckii]|uniref:MFS transporter n=1 Tax=Lactobacillus delbrueckii TaxID=1584 RepID=UPI001E541177|nr:MFS transporter [Lactobacillus delbrueckii]MCD5543112.1 MFS transporter [Lactobacillus delbrueckii subsp. lactis]
MASKSLTSQYKLLAIASGFGSILGSGIIVGLSATITVWQIGLHLSNSQVGVISGTLTFAIALGSLLAGTFSKKVGLIKTYNWTNLFYAIGTMICVLAPNYLTLLAGVIITGVASGLDLPISMTVISHDAPDDSTASSLVASTQIFWQIGVFMSYVCAFIVSKMVGATGARVVFSILTAFAFITWLWRITSKKFRTFHEEGDKRQAVKDNTERSEDASLKSVLSGEKNRKYLAFFFCILIFYVCWNLLANTFGQFQTFTLAQAHATQSFATGAGIILNFISLAATMSFAKAAGSKYRNVFFFIGILVQLAAMLYLAFSSHDLWPIVVAIGAYNIGNNLAGEALYKVWTQESFPSEARASVQGFINGFSRLCCGLFAFVTPALVVQSVIHYTMLGFAGLIAVSFVAGVIMINLQKKYKKEN